MMIDQKTLYLRLPLPHPNNELREDVFRLCESLNILDNNLRTLHSLMYSPDVNLDTVQEIVSVIKQAQGDIVTVSDLLAKKSNKEDVKNRFDEVYAEIELCAKKELFEKSLKFIDRKFSEKTSYAKKMVME